MLAQQLALHTWSDRALVAAYLEGSSAAFSHIVARHGTQMHWVARRYASNEDDALDILQEALFRASQSLDTFRHDAKLSTWLYRVVCNAGYDYSHRRCRTFELLTLDDTNGIRPDANRALAYEPMPHVDLVLMLRTALRMVRPEQAMALVLIDAVGHSVEFVARQQHVAPGTIKSRRARARNTLRTAMADCYG